MRFIPCGLSFKMVQATQLDDVHNFPFLLSGVILRCTLCPKRCHDDASPYIPSQLFFSGSIRPLGGVFLGRCVPWTMRSLDDALLGRCITWTMRSLDDTLLGRCIPRSMRPLDDASFRRCVSWTMRSLNDAFVTDLSRDWTAYTWWIESQRLVAENWVLPRMLCGPIGVSQASLT